MSLGRCTIWVLLAAFLNGCALLGSYPYPDESRPRTPDSPLGAQSVVEELSSPLGGVCHLTTTRRNIKKLWIGDIISNGSAALVQGRYLITAAHNVYDYPLGWLDNVDVSCNTKQASEATVNVSLNREQIKKQVSVPRYAWRMHGAEKKYEFDFAFVDLGKDLEHGAEFQVDDKVIPQIGEELFLGGYPGGTISDAHTLHVGKGKVVDINLNLMTYDVLTAKGNSGGPVWLKRDNKYYLVGVHVSDCKARLLNESFFSAWNEFLSRNRAP